MFDCGRSHRALLLTAATAGAAFVVVGCDSKLACDTAPSTPQGCDSLVECPCLDGSTQAAGCGGNCESACCTHGGVGQSSSQCGPASGSGCCDDANACHASGDSACGVGGGACQNCGSPMVCIGWRCTNG